MYHLLASMKWVLGKTDLMGSFMKSLTYCVVGRYAHTT